MSSASSSLAIDSRSFYSSLYRDLAEELRGSLKLFIQAAWPIIEPTTPLKWNWHLDEICELLESVSAGHIKKLIINVPPGTGKSRTLALWNAWEWTWNPSLRYLTSSHSKDLTIRDNLDVRTIVTSDWYQRLFWTDTDNPDNSVSLSDDQFAKIRFNTTARGYRIATSVGGHGVGEHPDRICLDDLITPQDARSDIALDNANNYLQNTISTRVRRDPAIVLIMQRLHENDPTGFILSKPNHGFTHVVFPMHYAIPKQDDNGAWSGGINCDCHRTRPDPLDHRTEEGELLWEEEFTESRVESIEILLGPIDSAGQLEQNPSLATGTLYSRDLFTIIDVLPREAQSTPSARGWDTADTDIANERKKRRKGDWTVGVKITGPIPIGPLAGKWIVEHVIRLKGKPQEVDTTIINTAELDGKRTKVREGAGVGKDTIDRRTQELAGWDYEPSPETDSKIERNRPFRVQAASGNVVLLRGEWNTPYLDVLCGFPTGKYDDDVDGTSNAFNALAVRPRKRTRYAIGR